jgi:hypothetical protein
MIRYTLVLVAAMAAWLSGATAFAQENQGTPEQRAACTPDAFRLCSAYIPDPARVEGCLRLRKADLSDACRAVFDHAATASARNK